MGAANALTPATLAHDLATVDGRLDVPLALDRAAVLCHGVGGAWA